MEFDEPLKSRRPGPIGFHGESKVTNLGNLGGGNLGGIGLSSPPTLERAQESKELSVLRPLAMGVSGVCIALIGLLIDLSIMGLGIWILIYSVFLDLNNGTIKRLSYQAKIRNRKNGNGNYKT